MTNKINVKVNSSGDITYGYGTRNNKTDQGVVSISNNFSKFNNIYMFAIYDAHGDDCSICYELTDLVNDNFAKYINNNYKFSETKSGFIKLFKDSDDKFRSVLKNIDDKCIEICKNNKINSGSTAIITLCEVFNDELNVVSLNIGDSSSYVYDGKFKELSTEKHLVSSKGESERILKTKYKIHNDEALISDQYEDGLSRKLKVSRGFGDPKYKGDDTKNMDEQAIICFPEIKSKTLKLNKNIILLMGSSGVFPDKDSIKFVKTLIKSKITEKRLISDIIKNAPENNSCSVLVVKFSP